MTANDRQRKYFGIHRVAIARRKRDRRAAECNFIGYELTSDGWRKARLPKEAVASYKRDWLQKKRRRLGRKLRKILSPEQRRAYRRAYEKNREKVDPNFRLRKRVAARIRIALKKCFKSAKTCELIGCSIIELRQHLENQFESWMNWMNYGQWNIDHIVPCSRFNLTDPDQQKLCFHFSNLQPMHWRNNLKKSNKIQP